MTRIHDLALVSGLTPYVRKGNCFQSEQGESTAFPLPSPEGLEAKDSFLVSDEGKTYVFVRSPYGREEVLLGPVEEKKKAEAVLNLVSLLAVSDDGFSPMGDIQKSRESGEGIEENYELEEKIKTLLLDGRKKELKELIAPKDTRSINEYKEQYGGNILDREEMAHVGFMKNNIMIMNTMFRLTVEQAGVPPVIIHTISDGAYHRIQRGRTENEFLSIISDMVDSYCDAINRMNIQGHSFRVTRVQKHIIANLHGHLALEDLSEVAGVSPEHLSRLFKAECGESITDYIRRQRVTEAKWMLETSDSKVGEIADALGFSSINYFSSVFRKETGETPLSYRARMERTRR